MGKIFYIMGKSAVGKDSIYQRLTADSKLGLDKIVTYTTRPIRSGEKEGVEYHFVDDETFRNMLEEGKVIEFRTYQTVCGPWTYFTADDGQTDLTSSSYIMIGTLVSYEKMSGYYGADKLVPIYIEVDGKERMRRSLQRENTQDFPNIAEVQRRFKADEEDFSEEKLAKAGITYSFVNDDIDRCTGEIISFIKQKK